MPPTERADRDLPADDPPMLRPEEYTLPGIEAPQLPTEDEYIAEETWAGAIPWPYLRFVADKLATVLKGDPSMAAVTLGIESDKPGRPGGSGKYSHLAVAAFYYLLSRAGVAPKAAKSLMRERIGVSDDVIEEAAKEYPGFQHRDRFTVEILVELAAVYRRNLAETLAAQRLRLS